MLRLGAPRSAAAGFIRCADAALVPTACATPTSTSVSEQRRGLKFAKTTFGYKLWRRGQRKPEFMRDHIGRSTVYRNLLKAPLWWRYATSKNPDKLLPKSNFITGEWTGLYHLPKSQVMTLQHVTSNAPLRIRRFPVTYTFNHPSRWLIGKYLGTFAVPRAPIVDETTLTKRQRTVMVRKGLIPK